MTYLADHVNGLSHDAVNRFLRNDKRTGKMIWEHFQGDIVPSAHVCLVFEDSVLDKGHSHCIEMVKLQYSGNAHGLIKGIGMVNCLYVNSETQQYWIVDYRIYDPSNDEKSKLDHVREMLVAAFASKTLSFNRVLVDSWYATKDLMLLIDSLEKIFYCLIKANRQVDDSGGVLRYRRVDSLEWRAFEKDFGKSIKANAANVLQAFTDKLLGNAQPMRLSMTYDQGRQMSMHKNFSEQTGTAVYFSNLHNPWQRDSNENMNGLVRQYLRKGTDLSIYSQEQLDVIADEINNRLRKGLGVRSPLAVYRELFVNSPQHSILIH